MYKARGEDYSEVQTLFENDGRVRCECDVTYPGNDSPGHRRVEDVGGSCTLSISRCLNALKLLT